MADKTVLCPGILGTGKTVLTPVVVEEISARFQNDKSIWVAYLCCNFRQHDKQRAKDLLTTLLKQLTQGRSSLPDIIKSLHDSYKDKRTRLLFDEISRTLQPVAAMYSRDFINADALDEFKYLKAAKEDSCQASSSSRQSVKESSLQIRD